MIEMRIDCEKPNWEEKALRYLYGDACLVGLSRSNVEVLERLAAVYGLRLRKEPVGDGWRLTGEVASRAHGRRSGDRPRSD